MKKILISAYACEPNKGSEPAVGWNWILEYAKDNEIWVITKSNNKGTILSFIETNKINLKNIHFVYVDLPRYLVFWKKGNRGIRLYYYLWQKKAYYIAKNIHMIIKFDMVHCLTFVSFTQPTYMYKLNIPLVWSIAGGENISKIIDCPLSIKEKLLEYIRELSQKYSLKLYWNKKTFEKAFSILATTEETKNMVPERFRHKVSVYPSIGIRGLYNEIGKSHTEKSRLKILMTGRLIYWKGFDIGIKAFHQIAEKYQSVDLYILGEGSKLKSLKKLSGTYLDNRIYFINKVEHDIIYDFYRDYDIFLNTSLRDSGCLVILEAMSVGLPIICINTGGPKAITDESSALRIDPCEYNSLINNVAISLEALIEDSDLRIKMGNAAKEKVYSDHLYKYKVKEVDNLIIMRN